MPGALCHVRTYACNIEVPSSRSRPTHSHTLDDGVREHFGRFTDFRPRPLPRRKVSKSLSQAGLLCAATPAAAPPCSRARRRDARRSSPPPLHPPGCLATRPPSLPLPALARARRSMLRCARAAAAAPLPPTHPWRAARRARSAAPPRLSASARASSRAPTVSFLLAASRHRATPREGGTRVGLGWAPPTGVPRRARAVPGPCPAARPAGAWLERAGPPPPPPLPGTSP